MKFLKRKNNFIFLLILSFIFISTTAISSVIIITTPLIKQTKNSKKFPSIPILINSNSFPIISAQSVLAIDLMSGIALYEKDPDTQLLPASTNKIITALVALDYFPLNHIVTVGIVKVDGQKIGLIYGTKISIENLLYALLVYSANDAAEVIAQNYPGGYDAFIQSMNTKAKELSMTNSQFQNPIGLDGPTQFSTARDLVRATEVAMRNKIFAKIVGTKNVTITDETGNIKYDIDNINQLLGNVTGVMGVKTGWTQNARENLVTYLERDDKKIIIALLGSQDRFGETKELIDWIFANYQWQEVNPN